MIITKGYGGVPEAQRHFVSTSASDTLRQRVISALDTRLKTITIANGYKTNLGNNIFGWRVIDLQESELPGAEYKDNEETTVIAVGTHLHTLPIEITINTQGGTSAEDARKLIADVVKCIGADTTFSGLAQDAFIGGSTMAADQKENKIIEMTVKVIIEYTTNPFDPYE